MGGSPSSQLAGRSTVRRDGKNLYVRLQGPTIFVRDMDRSLAFYADQLGFRVAVDSHQGFGRWAAVVPPDGTGVIALAEPQPESEDSKLIGRSKNIILLTEDVVAAFEEWSDKGVRFPFPPRAEDWGGIRAGFEDPDGNSFFLVSFDEASREIEAQRRSAQELEIAKQVQARFFPQTQPSLATLDYAGICLQAHPVGGDYYDFMDVGRNRVALVIGDVAGKGIAAALLMASLHATLRSQRTIAWDQPQRLLQSVNQFFYENTIDSAYVTLFLAEYNDQLRRLRYVNCGHWPALLLRHDARLERLDSTSTVLGLFKEWDCSLAECQLFPGDTLALYTDGTTEAVNAAGQEFGEERLTAALRKNRELPSQALLGAVVKEIQQFSPYDQHDDATLVVAKCSSK